MDSQLLEILACPKCKGRVTLDAAAKGLVCAACRLIYPVEDDIPIMLVDEARSIPGSGGIGTTAVAKGVALFRVLVGKDKGEVVQLERGSCKAIGRPIEDAGKTQVFNLGVNLSLDDHSKKLIADFVTKQFKKKGVVGSTPDLGAFKRAVDFILSDSSVSRLHAMLFYDQAGVGILDLVSKNGTFVNGDEVESRLLKDGDVIEVGSTKIGFELK